MRSEASGLGYINDDYGTDDDSDNSMETCGDAGFDPTSGANSLFQSSPSTSPFASPFSNGLGGLGSLASYGGSSSPDFSALSSYIGGASPNSGGSPNSVIAQLHNVLNQIASMLPSAVNGANSYGNQDQQYGDFHAASVGDPHDSFSGRTSGNCNVDDHWDDMRSHQDLLHSNSVKGGIRIATQTTAPDANGKTMNGKVTVHLNHERDAVSLDANGNATLSQNGNWKSLAPGSSVTLADGSTIVEGQDRSLSVHKTGNNGADLTTLLKTNGAGGVDVNVDGKNAQVGGYLPRHVSAA